MYSFVLLFCILSLIYNFYVKDSMNYIRFFDQIRITDIPLVGGKNASLGEMIQTLSQLGVRVPNGFALTVVAYHRFMEFNKLSEPIKSLLAPITKDSDTKALEQAGKKVRELILASSLPSDIAQELSEAYKTLSSHYGELAISVAVRSSATAEDLPNASFAGQQETFLNVRGAQELERACVKAYASLFTDRAIYYRLEHGFSHEQVALSIGIQKMVQSDVSGVAFSLDTETGFPDVVLINASYGLGELIVQGAIVPDEFIVHKPTFVQGFRSIIQKVQGSKKEKMIYGDGADKATRIVPVETSAQKRFCLTDDQVLELAHAVIAIEDHYTKIKKQWCPVDVEWALESGTLYIVQARPETVFSQQQNAVVVERFQLRGTPGKAIASGAAIGFKIASGKAHILKSVSQIDSVQKGDIIVTTMTDPDWVPALKKCAGIITEQGGRTCHAAIVSRELGIPAIVGVQGALERIKQGTEITIDCSQGQIGFVYEGSVPFDRIEQKLQSKRTGKTKLYVNVAEPRSVFRLSRYPIDGIGLARLEFVISNEIKIHPMALLHPERVKDSKTRALIDERIAGYATGAEFYIDRLCQAIGTLAAGMYPRSVTVRLSDFKSNEYRSLLGGAFFEPEEENPMIGWRGASRYYDAGFKEAFVLECQAIKKAREYMGMKNIRVMVPFVRTLTEAEKVVAILGQQGLVSGVDGLELVMMVEIPSNVILLEQFAHYFDSFSIGSNDLTQMVLGVDRDSSLVSHVFDERDPAVMEMLHQAIVKAHKVKKQISICGQAPSDYPDLAKQLVAWGIDGLSLNPDSVYELVEKIF